MYANMYKQASQMADLIRSGEYQKSRQKRIEDSGVQSLVSRPTVERDGQEEEQENELEFIANLIANIRDMDGGIEVPQIDKDPDMDYTGKRGEAPTPSRSSEQSPELRSDPEFMAGVDYMQQRWGIEPDELFDIMKGESNFNPTAQNSSTKAAGLFQFIPSTAEELGVTVDEVLNMSPSQQLDLYDRYLERWDYAGQGLGIMQAAPGHRNKGAEEVIYDVGSRAWEQNPGWRSAGGGAITRASINDYYRKER